MASRGSSPGTSASPRARRGRRLRLRPHWRPKVHDLLTRIANGTCEPTGSIDMAKATSDLFVVERDLRLDLLRGLGLWMIFLDHIPDDAVAWMTLRNYGFFDAAEFFVFISGYLLGFIYAPIIASGHFMPALKRLWLRSWQMY